MRTKSSISEELGAGATEYVLVVSLVGLVALTAFPALNKVVYYGACHVGVWALGDHDTYYNQDDVFQEASNTEGTQSGYICLDPSGARNGSDGGQAVAIGFIGSQGFGQEGGYFRSGDTAYSDPGATRPPSDPTIRPPADSSTPPSGPSGGR